MGRRTQNHPDRPKLCPMCKTVKPPEAYNKTRYNTLYTDCKACLKEYKAQMWRDKYSRRIGKPMESVLT